MASAGNAVDLMDYLSNKLNIMYDIENKYASIISKLVELNPTLHDKNEEILAEIQKIMTDKLPPERGAGIKSWMRISMLFNPKTQVRNI